MDKAVVERALRALLEIGAVQPLVHESPSEMLGPANLAPAHLVKAKSGPANAPLCASPDCAGCYDVGDGRKIHPPRIGDDYLAWLERWNPKGTAQ
jgi:hypothetical protein